MTFGNCKEQHRQIQNFTKVYLLPKAAKKPDD